MTFPQYPKKYGQEVIITHKQHFLAEKEGYKDFHVPNSVILCFESYVIDHFRKLEDTEHRTFWTGELVYLDKRDKEIALVGNFGIGGPASSHILEILIATGVRKFLIVGHAGGLQKSNAIGTIVLVNIAIRDEGVLHHYVKSEKYAYPSPSLLSEIEDELKKKDKVYKIGSSWTIDSMYRETRDEINHYALEGVATIEMELASLFAVATFRKVDLSSMLVISDYVGFDNWDKQIHSVSTSTAVFKSIEIAKKVLNE